MVVSSGGFKNNKKSLCKIFSVCYTSCMGRKKLEVGQPCRYGHPWNRSSDGKRCLTCYPNSLPYELLPSHEKAARAEAMVLRQQAWAEKRIAASKSRARNEKVPARERRKRQRLSQDFCWIALRSLNSRRAPGEPRASRKELRALWEKQQGRCALTGLPITGKPTIDHIVPVSAGGKHTVDNLQWVCREANMAKGTNSVAEFRAWLLTAAESLQKKLAAEALF